MNSEEIHKVTLKESEEILKKYFSVTKVNVIEVHQSLLSNVMGIMGGHYNLLIKFIQGRENENNLKEKLFFQKQMVTKYKIQDTMIKEQGAFKKEAFIYKIIYPELKKMWRTSMVPECFYIKEDAYFIMEHLGEQGFQTRPGNTFQLDMVHLKLALKAVAKFHATSIIFEKKTKTSLIEKYPDIFKEPLYIKDDNYLGNKLYNSGTKTVLKIIEQCPLFEENRSEIVETYLENVEELYNLIGPSQKYCNVLNHGDLWDKNLLFKYDNEVPVACMLIDFQALRYTIPAHDVLNLIYSVTHTNFRNKHLSEFLHHYFVSLSTYLDENGLDINNFMTFDTFIEQVDYIRPFAIIQTVTFFLMIILSIRPEIQDDEKLFENFMYGDYKMEVCLNEYKKKGMFYFMYNEYLHDILKLKRVKKA